MKRRGVSAARTEKVKQTAARGGAGWRNAPQGRGKRPAAPRTDALYNSMPEAAIRIGFRPQQIRGDWAQLH